MTEQIVQPVVTQEEHLAALANYQYGWADSDTAGASAGRQLTRGNQPGASTAAGATPTS